MNTELQLHLDNTFKKVPKTRASIELKEELLANATDRYNDLISEGYKEQDAIDIVIHSIGDVSLLLNELEKDTVAEDSLIYKDKKRNALYKTIALGLYIFGFIFAITLSEMNASTQGLIIMLLIYIFPTCLLVYSSLAFPKQKRKEQTIVEEFSEWNNSHKNIAYIRNLIIVILWLLIFIIYFLLSILTNRWEVTWILFLVAACASGIVILIFKLKETRI